MGWIQCTLLLRDVKELGKHSKVNLRFWGVAEKVKRLREFSHEAF